jgi:hypothetical protein
MGHHCAESISYSVFVAVPMGRFYRFAIGTGRTSGRIAEVRHGDIRVGTVEDTVRDQTDNLVVGGFRTAGSPRIAALG